MNEIYKDKEWLYTEYIIKDKSTREIAKEIGCVKSTILNWLKKFNIKIKPKGNSLDKHPTWKGGKYIDSKGYKLVYNPKHPKSYKNGYIFEHRLKAEEKLGRYLNDNEVVHHINFCKLDNSFNNLCIFSNQSEHKKVLNSLFDLIPYLIDNEIIYFNQNTQKYEL